MGVEVIPASCVTLLPCLCHGEGVTLAEASELDNQAASALSQGTERPRAGGYGWVLLRYPWSPRESLSTRGPTLKSQEDDGCPQTKGREAYCALAAQPQVTVHFKERGHKREHLQRGGDRQEQRSVTGHPWELQHAAERLTRGPRSTVPSALWDALLVAMREQGGNGSVCPGHNRRHNTGGVIRQTHSLV